MNRLTQTSILVALFVLGLCAFKNPDKQTFMDYAHKNATFGHEFIESQIVRRDDLFFSVYFTETEHYRASTLGFLGNFFSLSEIEKMRPTETFAAPALSRSVVAAGSIQSQNTAVPVAPDPAPEASVAPSFDCKAASNMADRMVCFYDPLGYKDRLVARLFTFEVKRHTEGPDQLRDEQRAWVARKVKCETVDCLLDAYEERVAVLRLAAGADLASGVTLAEEGDCGTDTIVRLGSRLDGDPQSGSVAIMQRASSVSYERVNEIEHSKVGDSVLVCLTSLPRGCPAADQRGSEYFVHNWRTSENWVLPDSEHGCGGA